MAKFLLYIDRILNLYLFYIVMAVFLRFIPNINPDYPLFHAIFVSAGLEISLPIVGTYFSAMLLMIIIVLTSGGLRKIYLKMYQKDAPEIIVWTRDDFEKNLAAYNKAMAERAKAQEQNIEQKNNITEENNEENNNNDR